MSISRIGAKVLDGAGVVPKTDIANEHIADAVGISNINAIFLVPASGINALVVADDVVFTLIGRGSTSQTYAVEVVCGIETHIPVKYTVFRLGYYQICI